MRTGRKMLISGGVAAVSVILFAHGEARQTNCMETLSHETGVPVGQLSDAEVNRGGCVKLEYTAGELGVIGGLGGLAVIPLIDFGIAPYLAKRQEEQAIVTSSA